MISYKVHRTEKLSAIDRDEHSKTKTKNNKSLDLAKDFYKILAKDKKGKMTANERKHLATIKSMPCGVCGDTPPSDAHHVKDTGRRVSHYLAIPLCKSCHQDSLNGIHGQKNMWRIMGKTELDVLAETIRRIVG